MVPDLLSDAHLPSFLFGALLSTQISADICCAQLPGARFSLHYEHGARVFLFTEMFSFLLVVLIHVTKNKSKKQKKNPKQTQKTSAQTVIYDKKGLLRKV